MKDSQHNNDLKYVSRLRATNLNRQLKLIRDVKDIVAFTPNPNNNNSISTRYTTNDDTNSYNTLNDKETDIIQLEINNIKDLFDKKKSILIPKISKNKAQVTKQTVNKNEDYTNTIYERPSSYIVYGELNREQNNKKFKKYEASLKEIEYLKKNDPSISINQYESAIIALEDDVEKGEMIPKERAIVVLSNSFPDKDSATCEKIYEVRYNLICFIKL